MQNITFFVNSVCSVYRSIKDFEIIIAVRYASLHEDIMGRDLSGEQCQRLMIARAIVPKPRILIFDEATSTLIISALFQSHNNIKHIIKINVQKGAIVIIYTIRQIRMLSEKDFNRAVEETTLAFKGDPTFDFIFRSAKELSYLVEVNLKYYLKAGAVFAAFDENNMMQGIALWNEPGGEPISAKTVLTGGLLGSFCNLFFHVRPGSFYRMLKMSDCTQENHYKGEHWYLYWITAFHPGAGGALLDDAAERFMGYDFYLENSNPEKNDKFYRKHGFEPLPEIGWKGCILRPMLRRKSI